MAKKKQAVIVFHGMGEQIPMQTLRSLVGSAWETDPKLTPPGRVDSITGGPRETNAVWSKPDRRNHSYELYRLTTEADRNGRRTDFFEFYWAHRVQGTTWEQVKSWIGDLMVRHPRRVPAHVRGVWIALWLFLVAVVLSFGLALYLANRPDASEPSIWDNVKPLLPYLSLLVSAVGAWLISAVFVKRVGDVVRYTNAKPENIATRQEIREAGVALLEELSGGKDGVKESDYDRIIFVAHSLGCIVAYDVLTHAFARCNRKLDFATARKAAETDGKLPDGFLHQPELRAVEGMVREAAQKVRDGQPAALDIDTFQAAQRAAQRELVDYGCPWLVTDFLTFGSPLGHAEFLIADGMDDLREAQNLRQFPTSPPVLEYRIKHREFFFTYPPSKTTSPGDPRLPHHAAMFAFTRWTNVHSPRKHLLWGDVVSGTVSAVFGLPVKEKDSTAWRRLSGIREIAVLPERDGAGALLAGHRVPWMTHNSYWDLTADTGAPAGAAATPPHHIAVLRDSLQLLEK